MNYSLKNVIINSDKFQILGNDEARSLPRSIAHEVVFHKFKLSLKTILTVCAFMIEIRSERILFFSN